MPIYKKPKLFVSIVDEEFTETTFEGPKDKPIIKKLHILDDVHVKSQHDARVKVYTNDNEVITYPINTEKGCVVKGKVLRTTKNSEIDLFIQGMANFAKHELNEYTHNPDTPESRDKLDKKLQKYYKLNRTERKKYVERGKEN